MSKLKTPADKKAASHAHDRRNAYGENNKSSRKNIPRSKAIVHRAERRVVRSVVAHSELTSVDAAEGVETRIAESKAQRLQGFKKSPDVPLGEYLERKRRRKRR
jgi:hypothetical protein